MSTHAPAVLARLVCWILGHRLRLLAVSRRRTAQAPGVLPGRDLDCLRCGLHWRDADSRGPGDRLEFDPPIEVE